MTKILSNSKTNAVSGISDAPHGFPLGLGALLLFLGLAQFGIERSLRLIQGAFVPVAAPSEKGSKWDPEVFKILSMGEFPTALDGVWLDLLLDDRISKVPRGTHARIFYDLDLITALDPAFFEAYRAGANLLAVVRDDVFGAKEILERGNRYRTEVLPSMSEDFKSNFWPNSWGIPFLQAYVFLFELGDLPSASFSFQEASRIPGSPQYLQNLEKRLFKPGGRYEVGLRLLNHMIAGATDEKAREELLKKRDSLRVGQFLDEFNRSFKDYLSSDRDYKGSTSLAPPRMQSYWKAFLKKGHYSARDPWGGDVSLDSSGRVITTTPHFPVLGLD